MKLPLVIRWAAVCGVLLAAGPARSQTESAPAAVPADREADPRPSLRELWVPSDALAPVLEQYPRAVPLTRDQLATLLRDARAGDPAAPDAANPPPARAVLRQAWFDGTTALGPDASPQVRVEAELEVEVLSDAWADVPLGLPGIALGTAEIDGPALPPSTPGAPPLPGPPALGRASLRRAGGPDGTASLQLQGRGSHRLRLGFVLPVATGPDGSSITLPAIDGTGEFALHLPAGTRADSGRGCAVLPAGAGVVARVALRPTASQPGGIAGGEPAPPAAPDRLNWRTPPPAPAGTGALLQDGRVDATVEAARVSVRQEISLRPALGRLPAEVRLALPAAARAVEVESLAGTLGGWDVGVDGLRVTLVPGGSERGGPAAFAVAYDLPLALDARGTLARVEVPLLEAAGAHRVTGRCVVRHGPDVQVRRIEPGAVAAAAAEEPPSRGKEGNAPAFVAGYALADLPAPGGSAAPPAAVTLAARRATARFSVDADARADFQLDGVHLQRTLAFQVEEGEVFTARVHLPPGETLLALQPAGRSPAPDWRQEGGDLLLNWTAGLAEASKTVLVLDSRADLLPPKPGAAVDFTFGAALVPGAERLAGYVALASAPALRLVTTGGEDRLERRDGRTTPVRGDVAWFYRDDFRLALRVEGRAAETEARFTGYALPLAGAVEIHAQLDYRFLSARVEAVRVRVPRESADAFFFSGEHIAERRLDGDVWTIRFQGEQSGDYTLGVQATIPSPVDRDDAQRFHFLLPAVAPLDTARWSGAWAVEANTDTEIRFATAGVNEADALHAPPLAGYQPRRRIIGVFEFLGGAADPEIRLDGVRHPPAGVAAAVVDRLDLETLAATTGVSWHRATVHARTAADGFFDLWLPESADLLSLTLDGVPVKPVGGAGLSREVRVELPGGRPPAQASTVVAVYGTPEYPWKDSGWKSVRAPGFDPGVPVLQSHWTLYLPEGYDYRLPGSVLGEGMPDAAPGDLLIPRLARVLSQLTQLVIRTPGLLFAPIQFTSAASPESIRRMKVAVSEENLRRGDADMIREDYEQAMHEYRLAVDALPDAPATQNRREAAMQKFFDAALKLAEQRITEGRYVDAETTVKVILRPEYNPNYKPGIRLLEQLEDPEYYNKTSGPKFIARVQQVKDLLNDANGFFDSGRYDLAYKRFEQVLSLDPYNDAARKGEERVDLARTKHSEGTGYPATRGHLIWDIAHGWEGPVAGRSGQAADSKKNFFEFQDETGTVAMNRKLQRIIIPHIEFRSTTISDAVEYLRQESARLDTESPADERGVNIFLNLPTGGADSPGSGPTANTRISLTLSGIPLLNALSYVAQQANLKVKVEQYAVSLVPLTEITDVFVTREFHVPSNFVGSLADGSRQPADEFLKSNGVQFPAGASATYLPVSSKLVVRNTQENIDLVETLVNEGTAPTPPPRLRPRPNPRPHVLTASAKLTRKLKRIIIPHIEFRSAKLGDAVEFVRRECARLDTESPAGERGVNISLRVPAAQPPANPLEGRAIPGLPASELSPSPPAVRMTTIDTRVSLTLNDIPALEALQYIAQQANLKVRVEDYAVSLAPLTEVTDVFVTREFIVGPDVIASMPTTGSSSIGGGALDQGAVSATATTTTGTNTAGQITRQPADEFLKANGIQFPPGASATYLPATGKLVIRNTQENIDLADALVNEPDMDSPQTLLPRLDERESAAGVAGLLPLRLDLPANGRPYEFAGGGAPGTLEFHYSGRASTARWRWVCLTLGALGFLLGAAGWVHPWRRTGYAALALTFFPLVAAPAATVTCNALLAGWLWAVAGWLLTRLLLRRRRLAPVLLLGLAALLPAPAHAAPEPPPSPAPAAAPELVIVPYDATRPATGQEPTQYYLPYARFLSLWDAAKRHRQPPAPEPPPGADRYTLSAARYDARLRGDTLEIDAALDLQTSGEGWVGVPLRFEQGGIRTVTLDGTPAVLGADGALWVGTPGAHRVGVALRLAAGTLAAGSRLAWSVPPAAATLVTLVLPRADLRAEAGGTAPGSGEVEEITPEGRQLTASLGATPVVQLTFHDAPAPAPAAAQPVLARVHSRLLASARQESVRAEIDLEFPGSAQDHFTVRLDRSLTLTDLDASDLQQWRLATEGDRQTLEIALKAPARDGYRLTLAADRPIAALPAERRTFPVVSAQAARVELTTALLTAGAVEISLPDGPPAGARRVDDTAAGRDALFAAFAGDGSAALVYSVRAAIERRRAHIDYLYQVGRGKIELAAAVRLVPAAGGTPLSSVDLRLPEGFTVQAVEGAVVRQWWREGDVLSVRCQPEAGDGEVPLLVYLVRQFDRAPERFDLHPLVAAGFAETDGQTVVAADRSGKVGLTLPTGARTTELGEIDAGTAAPEFQVKAPLERQRAFRYRGAEFDVAAALEVLPARWQAQWVTQATVRDGAVALETHVNAQALQGAVDALEFSLPPGGAEARVSGPDVRDTLTTGGGRDRRTYRVLFQKPLAPGTETQWTISQEISLDAAGRAAVPDLTLAGEGGRAAGGFVLVENASSGEMTLDPRGLEPTIEKDVPFLPPLIVAGTRFFRAAPGVPWSLGLRVTPLEKTAGREALVVYAELTSTLRADGEEWHRANYRLQNRRLQFLPVELPAGTGLIGARVAGESVRVDAGPGGRGAAPALLVPLLKTRPGEMSYDVELIYHRPAPGPEGRRREPFLAHWRMQDPRLPGVPVEKTLWNVYLPADARLLNIGGNLEPVVAALTTTEKLESSLGDLRNLSATFQSASARPEERRRALANYQALAGQVTQAAKDFSPAKAEVEMNAPALFKRPNAASQNALASQQQQSILDTVNSLNLSNTAAAASAQAPSTAVNGTNGIVANQRPDFDGFINYGSPIPAVRPESVVGLQWRDNRVTDAGRKAAADTGNVVPDTKEGRSSEQFALNDSVAVDLPKKESAVPGGFVSDKKTAAAREDQAAKRLSTARAQRAAEPTSTAVSATAPPDEAPVPAMPGAPAAPAPPRVDASRLDGPATTSVRLDATAGESKPPAASLRSEGRISLAVDFPTEGRVYHFKKIKADARLTLWSIQPSRWVRPGWLGVLLAILALAWVVRRWAGWRAARRAHGKIAARRSTYGQEGSPGILRG